MKKTVLIMLAFFLVFLATISLGEKGGMSHSDCDDGYFILCKPKSRVNVRENPRKNASVVGWVEFGRFVHTDGKEKNGFVHVIDLAAETTEGWVYAGYLVYDQPREGEYIAEVWGGNVIARSCVGGKQLRVLHEGKRVIVYARSNAWAYTNKGYVMCDWLMEVDE